MTDALEKPQPATSDRNAEMDRSPTNPRAVLAAAKSSEAEHAQRLESLGVTATEVRLWTEKRGPGSCGIKILAGI